MILGWSGRRDGCSLAKKHLLKGTCAIQWPSLPKRQGKHWPSVHEHTAISSSSKSDRRSWEADKLIHLQFFSAHFPLINRFVAQFTTTEVEWALRQIKSGNSAVLSKVVPDPLIYFLPFVTAKVLTILSHSWMKSWCP